MKKNILAITTIGMLLLSSFAIAPAFSGSTEPNEPSNGTTHYVGGKENKQQPELTLTDGSSMHGHGGVSNSQMGEIIVWDNGMNYEGLLAAQWDTVYNLDPRPADDFHFDVNTVVNDVHWIGGYWNGDPATFDWEITFFMDNGTGNAPGGIYAGPFVYTWDAIAKIELVPGEYEMSVYLPEDILFTGCEKFWISIIGIGDVPPQSGWGYHADPILLHQAVFKSVYFGYPDWTNVSDPGLLGYPADMAFQLTSTAPCSIDVEKYVWDPVLEDWVDADDINSALDLPVGETAEFMIAIHNDGTCKLYDIYVNDTMEDSLEFVDADILPEYTYYDPPFWYIGWYFPGPLAPCEWINITIWATVLGPHCSIDENYVHVDAYCQYEEEWVEDEDSAFVHCVDPCHIDVEKYVRETYGGPCDYTLCLYDTYGDGWNGGYLDVYVNGSPVYTGLTIIDGHGPECYLITVMDLDKIFLDYTYGSYPDENIWYLLDCDNNLVAYQQGGDDNDLYDLTVKVDMGTWVDYVDLEIGTTAKFLIAIHNDGMYDLYNIYVNDTMEDSLEFLYAEPQPYDWGYSKPYYWMEWYFDGPLAPCEWIYITVWATVLGPACETDENYVHVDAYCQYEKEWVEDEDSAFVHAIPPPPNNPPDKPKDPDPANGSKDVDINPTLSVNVTDPDGDTMNVTFYDAKEDKIIGTDTNVSNGTRASTIWPGLEYNTTYYWYAVANDSIDETTSDIWNFTTESQPPIANFTYTPHGLKVDFNGTKSYDPDGTITNYTWYFGDGKIGYEELVQHTYDFDGDYDVSLNVTDNSGKTDNITKTITVENATPIVDFTFSVDGKKVKFTSLSYDIDGSIKNWTWYFGDGNISYLENPEHTYAEECKTYKVTLNITDNMGLHNETSKDVTTSDTTKPTIEIVKPKRAVYINNEKKLPRLIRLALIIGDITIEVNASDEGSGMEKVEFYAGLLGTKYLGNDTTEPYSFDWTRDRIRFFHIQILTVKAYDKAGNVAVKRMIVRKLL